MTGQIAAGDPDRIGLAVGIKAKLPGRPGATRLHSLQILWQSVSTGTRPQLRHKTGLPWLGNPGARHRVKRLLTDQNILQYPPPGVGL